MSITIPEHILTSPQPVACVGTFTTTPGNREAFLHEVRKILAPVRAEKGCEAYEFHTTDDTIVLYERWTTGPDLATHGTQPHLKAYGTAIAGMVDPTSITVTWMSPVEHP
ncbi:putative quinol monooxygenase [Actinoplanes couchii]|uniref:ABM domain-containing protein n=1 Tax=Actinoplanes couchii TaxID=403638 RepID=A0ABQ3XEZ3_9ACTN|nr:putative quinol monooxygenase [Actinoplanes couchii]MDR6319928.1 quinol monooxygenase YgiN [Actinoplanes couchii]GID57065.1 hypothetical protein Aco03nite_054690 [Actinoplanes couchii]